MKAAIIMGSKSDYPVVEKAEDILKERDSTEPRPRGCSVPGEPP